MCSPVMTAEIEMDTANADGQDLLITTQDNPAPSQILTPRVVTTGRANAKTDTLVVHVVTTEGGNVVEKEIVGIETEVIVV